MAKQHSSKKNAGNSELATHSTQVPAVVLVDLQKAYFRNLNLEHAKQRLVNSCNKLLQYAHREQVPVIAIRTAHKADTSTWTLNMLEEGQGYLFEHTDDTHYIPGLSLQNATEVTKTRDSAFKDTILETVLRTLRVGKIFIGGVSTHTCIMQTASDAYALNFRVTLAKDCIASHDPSFDDMTFRYLSQEYRQEALLLEEINLRTS